MLRNFKTAPEYANAKTAVWWDMDTCPVPDGYDAGRVRPSIEGALKKLGYYGPVVTITAMGNLKEADPNLLQRLSSTGIVVQYAITELVGTLIFSDLMEFKRNNSPPATIMLISNKLDLELSFPLGRNQQIQRGYNLVRVGTDRMTLPRLYYSAERCWKTLLEAAADSVSQDTTTSYVRESFFCRACKFTGVSFASFTSHLSTEEHEKMVRSSRSTFIKHIQQESVPDYFSPFLTAKMNDQVAPEYVNSKTAVWWDMDTCPLPDGYDARLVRPSIEGSLKDLGYCGPVTITAMGNLENAHPRVLQGLSSTGILVQHTRRVGIYIYYDVSHFTEGNPPPATIMLVSDDVENFSRFLSQSQQCSYYNLVLARTYTPQSMSRLYYTAEWLWQTLLARSQETTSYVLRKCTASGYSASSLLCKSCDFTSLSVTDFTSHLSSEEHKRVVSSSLIISLGLSLFLGVSLS